MHLHVSTYASLSGSFRILQSLDNFHDSLVAATCNELGATEHCHLVTAAGRRHGDHFCIHAVLDGSCSGQATEPVDESCGMVAAAQSMDGSIEKPHIDVKDEHLYCRALLLAPYVRVRFEFSMGYGYHTK